MNSKINSESIAKWITLILVILVIVSLAQASYYTVRETESAVVTTFGKASLVDEKGLHFKIPFVQKVEKVDTTVRGIQIGYSEDNSGDPYEHAAPRRYQFPVAIHPAKSRRQAKCLNEEAF